MLPALPAAWRPLLKEELGKPYFRRLEQFVEDEQQAFTVYPTTKDIFAALKLTPYKNVNVLLLGQDPTPEKVVLQKRL